MRVSELAKKLKITPDTVRYYTRIGYLNPKTEAGNLYRNYGATEERCLRFILSARQLGFSVEDVGQLLHHADQGDSPCPVARKLIVQRLNETDRRFEEMLRLRKRMADAVNEWESKPNREPNGDTICHLIESFTNDYTNAEE
ncbi:MAG: MerR family DNA-binding protein [Pseudomonadales bacterium]